MPEKGIVRRAIDDKATRVMAFAVQRCASNRRNIRDPNTVNACYTCLYQDRSCYHEPCISCVFWDKWQKKEAVTRA